MPFTVYIDESGEAGIAKVRDGKKPGASPYFVLGAAVLLPAGEIAAKSVLEKFDAQIGKKKWRHATDLDHSAKVLLAREMSKLHVRYFAVVSNKSTLGNYRELIRDDPQKFYNKCLSYLLERVCGFLSPLGVTDDDLSVVLEKRNHDYDRMIRYLLKVKENPHYPESKTLSLLNSFGMVAKAKDEEPLLKLADTVSHSVYQCVNKTKSNYHIPETRYFEELSSRFGSNAKGEILGTGLKAIHSMEQLALDEKVARLLENTRATPPRRI